MRPSDRLAGVCGLLAPVSFVGAWAVCGALRDDGYDPVQDAISQLARVGSPTRAGMTAGFVGFGLLLPVFAQRLPRQVVSRAGRGAAAATAATVSAMSATALVVSVTAGPTGLWQRVGLGVVDAWFAGWALWTLWTLRGARTAAAAR